MSNAKAVAAKEKGNEAFKAGDYPTAIGHYTTAVLADRTDATYTLNRAAAYLKLGKNEDAERDCTTALELSPNNVKALFRRGLARMALSKYADAREDLVTVLKLEPSNQSVQQELRNLASLLQKETEKRKIPKPVESSDRQESTSKPNGKAPAAEKKTTSASSPTVSPHAPAPDASLNAASQRRRVPINIIDADGNPYVSPSASTQTSTRTEPEELKLNATPKVEEKELSTPPPDASGLTAVSSRSLKKSTQESPPTSDASTTQSDTGKSKKSAQVKPSTFQAAKQTRDSTRTTRVGGGIFKSSGESTIFPTRDIPVPEPSSEAPSTPLATEPAAPSPFTSAEKASLEVYEKSPPTTLFDFNKAWGSFKSVEGHWNLIKAIPPLSFPALCGTSLEPALLTSILSTFVETLDRASTDPEELRQAKKLIAEYLEAFSRIPRLSTILLFLSKSEKEVARTVWNRLGLAKPPRIWAAVL